MRIEGTDKALILRLYEFLLQSEIVYLCSIRHVDFFLRGMPVLFFLTHLLSPRKFLRQ
jgi:hypothetical protein